MRHRPAPSAPLRLLALALATCAATEAAAAAPDAVRAQAREIFAASDDNAIYELEAALLELKAYRFPVMWNAWTLGSFRASALATPGPLGDAMRRFAAAESAGALGGAGAQHRRGRAAVPDAPREGQARAVGLEL